MTPPAPETAAPAAEAALRSATRKVTRRLIPYLGLLYFINYLDRTNLAFAGPNGMNQALGLSATAFGFASGVFFIGYLLLEVPSNLALHHFGARRWIARILLTWGAIAAVIAFVPSAGWLYALRFLLGIAEAGFFPGIILYLTYWVPERDRGRTVALFMAAVPLSSAIGAPLSALLIEHTQGWLGLAGWRWMFLLQGVPAVILGVVTWFFLTDRPHDARWLAGEERSALAGALDAEQAAPGRHASIRDSLTRGRVWTLAAVYFGIVYGLYALGFFLPTIIAGFQRQYGVTYSILERGLITAIPYVLGAIAMIVWARHADRTGERIWHVALPAAVGGLAIPVTLYLGSPLAAMVAISICTIGIMCALPTFWALPPALLTGVAAASGIALINSIGNVAGFAGPYLTGWFTDLTGSSKTGLWVVGACLIIAGAITVLSRTDKNTHRAPSAEPARGSAEATRSAG
jgi:MFS family permease